MYQNKHAINMYKKSNLFSLKDKILNANPKELIDIVFDILHSELRKSIFLIKNNQISMKGESISYSISMIESVLIPALHNDENFMLAQNLKSLYIYCIRVLLEANLNNDVKKIKHVNDLLRKVSSAWKLIK
ncbi:flagellin chaperone [Wigglesworthia glossinidia endosymbiont of Glossina morsitans morsitans (Yale colony)]|uniref:Flagellar secretion chaperone FliS n=1 Tax=Wigglesworthia glossinidia endosymbiont of Glossina morsitans morsitans (Yale colony) TaxID=1142511 RepID=H6Q5M2_WIGGL|nr:flagellar export chaperone FliS [Wigglesworthia glossinidia]AFA40926.1 flagellin chaperone [Wigglesworthia glossinidia endosymbiont of Glossina morsitans morsitans (Yale colony)]